VATDFELFGVIGLVNPFISFFRLGLSAPIPKKANTSSHPILLSSAMMSIPATNLLIFGVKQSASLSCTDLMLLRRSSSLIPLQGGDPCSSSK